jgi:hypothetical protein
MSKDNAGSFLLAPARSVSLKCVSGCPSAETFAQTSRCAAAPDEAIGEPAPTRADLRTRADVEPATDGGQR